MPLSFSPLLIAASLAAVGALLPRAADRRRAAPGLLLVALAAAATVLAPGDGSLATLIGRATFAGVSRTTLLVDAGLALAGLVIVLLATASAVRARNALPERTTERAARDWWPVVGGVAVLLAPTLWLTVVACASLAWSVTPTAARRRPWLVLAVSLPLAAMVWLACQVGGTLDVRLSALAEVPLSNAAQRVAAVPLLAAALLWIVGAWSANAWRQGTAWVGVWLVARVGTVLVPSALESLAPLLWPLAVVGIGWAGWRRRPHAAAVSAFALAALSASTPAAGWRAVAGALALGAVSALALPHPWRRGAWAGAAVVACLALPAVLRAQVVWTVGVLLALCWAAVRTPSDGGVMP